MSLITTNRTILTGANGDTDAIVSSEGRLATDAIATTSPIPAYNVIYIPAYLTNSASPSLLVNGVTVPVAFSWSPADSDIWYLTNIMAVMIDNGALDPSKFGAITGGLTNGILVEIKSNGTVYTICTLKNNTDLALLFGGGGGGSSDGGLISSGDGFWDSKDVFLGIQTFHIPIKLDASLGDYVKVTVRDNLTSLNHFCLSIKKFKLIS